MDPEGFAQEAAAIQAMGFPAYKMCLAKRPERDLEIVELIRAATGSEFGLMVDAQQHGIRSAFHSWGNNLEVLAATDLGICWPESTVEWLEYLCYSNNGKTGMYPFPIAQETLQDSLQIQDGNLTVPQGPGQGIDINLDIVKKYLFEPGPWSFFKLEDPPSEVAVPGDHSLQWVDSKVSK